MKLEFSQQILEKCSNIKCHENLSKGSRVDPCRRTLMTKLAVAFRNFANAPKKVTTSSLIQFTSVPTSEIANQISACHSKFCSFEKCINYRVFV